MTPSSPGSLTSSFVSLSLSQARSRSPYPPESSGEESEFIVLERSTPPLLSPSSIRGTRNGSSSSGFSLVQAHEADHHDEEDHVARWVLNSPARPSGPSTPTTSSYQTASGRLEHQPDGSVSSSSEHGGSSSASGSQAGTSRRARQRVRARARLAQSRREAAAEGARGLGISPPSSTSSNYEVGPTRPWADDERSEREDEDEVDSVLWSEFTEEDATDVIDEFLSNSVVFMLQGDNGKLQLWQALCVELGLCLPPNTSSYASTSSSRSRSNSTHSTSSSDSDHTTAPTHRSITPTQDLYHPFPTSLTQANKLLKAHAFVNLKEYFATRSRVGDGTSSQRDDGDVSGGPGYGGEGSASGGRSRVSTEEGRRVRNAALARLRHPNKNALRRYTQKNRLYVSLGAAKEAWLQPLLIDMFFPQNGRF